MCFHICSTTYCRSSHTRKWYPRPFTQPQQGEANKPLDKIFGKKNSTPTKHMLEFLNNLLGCFNCSDMQVYAVCITMKILSVLA